MGRLPRALVEVLPEVLAAVLAAILLAGCPHPGLHREDQTMNQIVITARDQLDAVVGKLVTLQGTVANTRMPTLCGVDIESDSPDLRGQPAVATGVLEREVVTKEQLDRQIAEEGQFDHRGPGTFYRLVDPRSGVTVQVQRP